MKISEIKSKKFTLRPFRKGDELSLAKNINNKNIYKNTANIPYPYTLKDAKDWVSRNLKNEKEKTPNSIHLALIVGGEVAGSVSLMNIKLKHKAEIGYWLAEQYWGKGIMSQAVKLVTDFGFKKLKLKRIYAHTFSFNKGSSRVLEKSGFKPEGILRKHHMKDGKLMDLCVFGKVR